MDLLFHRTCLAAILALNCIALPASAATGPGASLIAKAEQGDLDAQSLVAWHYQLSDNREQALKWYRSAAEKGHATAQFNFCQFLAEGLEVKDGVEDPGATITPIKAKRSDIAKAIKWCEVSARRGQKITAHTLGVLYARGGAGIKPNYQEAYFWLSRSKGAGIFRDKVAAKLTPTQVSAIEQRAQAWEPGP